MRRLGWWARCAVELVIQLQVLARIEWLVRRRGLPHACRALGIELRLDGVAGHEPALLRRRYTAVVRAARVATGGWPFGNTCLRRAMLLGSRMRAEHPVLRIGIRPDGAGTLAHAWVEIDGRTLDPTAPDFGPMLELGGERA